MNLETIVNTTCFQQLERGMRLLSWNKHICCLFCLKWNASISLFVVAIIKYTHFIINALINPLLFYSFYSVKSFETGNICPFQKTENFGKRNNKSLSIGQHILFRKRSWHCHRYRRRWNIWLLWQDPTYPNAVCWNKWSWHIRQ